MIKESNTFLRISLFSYLVYVFAPITRILPDMLKAAFIGIALLCLILHLLSENKYLVSFTFKYIIGFVLIDFLIYQGVWRTNGAITMVNKSLMLFVFWMPFLYIKPLEVSSESTIRFIRNLLELLLIIEIITTCIGNIIFPMASRLLASPLEVEQNRIFQMANIGGYGFIYALVIVLPMFIYRYKEKRNLKYLIIMIGISLTIAFANYMTAVVLSLTLLYFSLSLTSKKGRFWGLVVIAIIYCLGDTILESILTLSANALSSDNHIMSERLANIHEYITEGSTSGDMGYRDELRNSSWFAFLSSPIWGNLIGNFSTLGLHSEFIDWLGGTGLFGFSFIFVILYKRVSLLLKLTKGYIVRQYFIISLFGILVFGFMNVITSAPEISAAVVVMAMTFRNSNDYKLRRKSL